MKFFTELPAHPIACVLFLALVLVGIVAVVRTAIEHHRLKRLIYALPQLAETLPSLIKKHGLSVVVTPSNPDDWFAPHEKQLTLGSLRITIRCSPSARIPSIDPVRDHEHARTWVVMEEFWITAPTILNDGCVYARLRDDRIHYIAVWIGDPRQQYALTREREKLHPVYQEAAVSIRNILFTLA